MASKRKRILCIIDREEQVVFGTIRYEPGREPDDAVAVIVDEAWPQSPVRISEWDVLEVARA